MLLPGIFLAVARAFASPLHEGPSELWSTHYDVDPSPPRIAVAGVDQRVHVLWLETDRELDLPAHPGRVFEVEFSPDGSRILTSCSDGKARVFELQQGRLEASFDAHAPGGGEDWIGGHARWSKDGTRILAWGKSPHAVLWDLATRTRISSIGMDSGDIELAVWSPDSKSIATASSCRVVRIWDGTTGEPRSAPIEVPTREINDLAIHPDGHRLAVACADAQARIFDLRSGRLEWTASHEDEDILGNLAIGSVRFSQDGKHFLTTSFSYYEVRSWDVSSRRVEWRSDWGGGNECPICAEYSPDGTFVLVDHCARKIDPKSGETQRELTPSCLHSLSRDGRFVIAQGESRLDLVDAGDFGVRYRIALSANGRASLMR